MSFEAALRATELLLALAFMQSSAEHLLGLMSDRVLFLTRITLCICLLAGLLAPWVLLALCAHSLVVLHRFNGPYNGGSDKMALLVLYCATAAHWMPTGAAQDLALGYLAVQLVLSYVISGQVKLVNPDWRSGQALSDVFRFSVYPVSGELRVISQKRVLLWAASWAVILFEMSFPLALLNTSLLYIAISLGLTFHFANAMLFGLNRFIWSWAAAYPSLIWMQGRVDQLF